jgi:hypothetical protein
VDRWYRSLEENLDAVAEVYGGNIGPLLDPDNASARDEYEQTLRAYAACSRSLDEEVESAPSARLGPAREAAVRACERFEEAAEATLVALAGRNYPDLVRLEQEWGAAWASLYQVFMTIDKFARDARPLPTVSGTAGRSHVDAELSQVVSSLAGFDAEVRCWAPREWKLIVAEGKAMSSAPIDFAGFTSTNLKRVNVRVDVCTRLHGLENSEGATQFLYTEMAAALKLVAHEAMHVAGHWDEADAECYGLQHVATVATELGAREEVAADLAELAWRTYPGMPASYRSPDCRNGGLLDLDRTDDRWP